MELTNHSYLNSRNNYLSSLSSQKLSAERFASGKKLDRSGTDVGALSQESNRRIELLNDRASITNLKNARSFLYAQETSLHRVYEMYDKIEVLAIKAANPNTTEEERRDYNLEFNDYKEQLENLMVSRYNDKLLFSNTLMCGGVKNVPLGELDLVNGKGAATHAVRAQTVYAGSPSGTVTFRINSGVAGDIYRVYMGNQEIFSMGSSFAGPDFTKQYNDPSFTFPNDGWRTSNSANDGDDDRVEVTFGPGQPTTYKIYLGESNRDPSGKIAPQLLSNSGALRPGNDSSGASFEGDLTESYDNDSKNWKHDSEKGFEFTGTGPVPGYYNNVPKVINTSDLPANFDRTELTLQIETKTIGIIYDKGNAGSDGDSDDTGTSGVQFTPSEFIRDIPTDAHGNNIELNSKGFETLEIDFLLKAASAQELVDIMRGEGLNEEGKKRFGEMKCLLENRLGILGAEYRRIDYEVEELEKQIVADENALGRITDTDMAKEATNFAKESLKMKLASEIMSNVSRLKDVLIPLTTEHFRSEVLSATL
jgi:flagellin-like hook-associated protein FlgL